MRTSLHSCIQSAKNRTIDKWKEKYGERLRMKINKFFLSGIVLVIILPWQRPVILGTIGTFTTEFI